MGDPNIVPEIVGSLLQGPPNKVPLVLGNSHFNLAESVSIVRRKRTFFFLTYTAYRIRAEIRLRLAGGYSMA